MGSAEVWNEAAGKYSFIIGNNFLTYNTWTILHSNNSTNYASGSVKVADSSIDNINNTNRAGSSRVNFFETYGSGDIMPTTYGNTMEICSTRSVHWQPNFIFLLVKEDIFITAIKTIIYLVLVRGNNSLIQRTTVAS